LDMLPTPLENVALSDIDALVTTQVPESRTIEYKQALPSNSDSDKKEFLADVTSFANSVGGYLIYGIAEDNGIAREVLGVEVDNIDLEVRRLDSMLISGIYPRMRYRIQSIPHSTGRFIVIVKIDRSAAAPHRVTFKGHDKFYARSSAGKYPLDVNELRDSFLRNSLASDRIKEFRIERLSALSAGEGPILESGHPLLLLHLLPLEAFTSSIEFDISQYYVKPIKPIDARAWDKQINIDGVLYWQPLGERVSNYVQLYRNGCLEIADEFAFSRNNDGSLCAPLEAIERRVRLALPGFIECIRDIGATPPVYLFLSMIGAASCRAWTRDELVLSCDHRVLGRDPLLLPEIALLDFTEDLGSTLRPLFNRLWNAFGLEGSSG
jgi:hypothetical protein